MLVIVYLCSMQAHINKNKSLHYSNYFLFLIDMKNVIMQKLFMKMQKVQTSFIILM